MYLGSKKFGKQIDYAVRGRYTHVAIMGASELESGIIKLKDLGTREEIELPIDNIAQYFAK
jgi:histidyl-tRNA synthetase